MSKPCVALIVGTRPEVVKLAPVCHALDADDRVDVEVVAVCQQPALLEKHLSDEALCPTWTLPLQRETGSLSELLAEALGMLDSWLTESGPPDLVLVQGDTTTALAGALAAFHRGVPVGHVEAGLRTDDPCRPFPEEMNRRLISRIALLHFAPTRRAWHRLNYERGKGGVHMTGNTVVDALAGLLARPAPQLPSVPADYRKVALVTCHRREGWDSYLPALVDALARLEGWFVIWPVHPNPLVQEQAGRLLAAPHVHTHTPVDRAELVHLIDLCDVVLTDSGGIIEEACSLETPVLILRQETERGEALDCGLGKLVTVEQLSDLGELLDRAQHWTLDPAWPHPFGDGHAGVRIAELVASFLLDQAPTDAAGDGAEDVNAPEPESKP